MEVTMETDWNGVVDKRVSRKEPELLNFSLPVVIKLFNSSLEGEARITERITGLNVQ